MNRAELQTLMDYAPVLTGEGDIEGQNREHLNQFLAHPGFVIFWGLMLGARQGYYAAIAQHPAGSTEEIRRLGVLQGTIKGIELVAGTALEQLTPSGTDTGAE